MARQILAALVLLLCTAAVLAHPQDIRKIVAEAGSSVVNIEATRSLDEGQRTELFERVDSNLLDVAEAATIDQWRRRLALEVKNIQRHDGVERLERQRRATSLRTWTDGEGMWCLSGRFDPVTGVKLSAAIDTATNALFAEQTPATCPSHPVDKQQHLAALALAELIDGRTIGGRPGKPEYVVVVDTSAGDGAGGPEVDWVSPSRCRTRYSAS